MAVPENSEINEKIYQVMKSRNIGTAWIGVYRDDRNNFITVSGVNVSYTNWYPNEPSNDNANEGCVELMNIVLWTPKYGAVARYWNDVPCTSSSQNYVCELYCKSQT